MTRKKRRVLASTLTATILVSIVTGCSVTNPYEVKDKNIDYYANIDSGEVNKAEEIYEGEDGGSSTIYRATITLPDKKKTLEKDPEYLKYEEAIKESEAYNEASKIKEIYLMTYSDLQNNNILVNMLNDNLVISNFRYDDDKISFTAINYSENDIDLRNEGVTIYIYDGAGYPIGVYQPEGVVPGGTEYLDLEMDLPVNKFCTYLGFGTTENDYSDYMERVFEIKNYFDELKPKSELVDY